jgi:hypothetical protein
MQMTQQSKRSYTPPLVVQSVAFLLEQDLLTLSLMTEFVFETYSQDVVNLDFDGDYLEGYDYYWD